MNVRLTPRALAEIRRMRSWWLVNRPSVPALFDVEIADAVDRIRAAPTIGAIYPTPFDVVVRRVLMPKTRNHVYYTVREGELVVLSVWGAPRQRGPRLT